MARAARRYELRKTPVRYSHTACWMIIAESGGGEGHFSHRASLSAVSPSQLPSYLLI